MQKPFLYCDHCNQPFHYKKPLPLLLKPLQYFIPIHRFYCAKCLTSRYKIIDAEEFSKYQV